MVFIGNCSYSQDTTFVKKVLAGSSLKVPKNKTWQIEKAYINAGDEYNIKTNTNTFKTLYKNEDTIQIPSYVVEIELLENKSMLWFILYIKQKNKI